MGVENNNAPAGQGPASANGNDKGKDKEISRGYIYKDDLLCLDYLTNEQKGLLLDATNKFMFDNIEPEIVDNIVKVAFAPIRQHIIRDYKAYLEKCEINRKNSNERKCVKEHQDGSKTLAEEPKTVFHDPSKIVDPRWKNQEIGGVLISAREFHSANNLFFWKNYPTDQFKACYDYYGQRKEGWGQWTTPNARWCNAICKWSNRTGETRFPGNILSMIGDIFELSPDEVKNCITRSDFNVVIQTDNVVRFIYGSGLQIGKWLQENRETVERITRKYGFGKISGSIATANGR